MRPFYLSRPSLGSAGEKGTDLWGEAIPWRNLGGARLDGDPSHLREAWCWSLLMLILTRLPEHRGDDRGTGPAHLLVCSCPGKQVPLGPDSSGVGQPGLSPGPN